MSDTPVVRNLKVYEEKLRLDPHEQFELDKWLDTDEIQVEMKRIVRLEPATDMTIAFDAVKNATKVVIVNLKKVSNIFFIPNNMWQTIPLASITVLSNDTDWGQLDAIKLKSINQTDYADIYILVYGSPEAYNGNGNP